MSDTTDARDPIDQRRDLIETKINPDRASEIAISGDAGGLDVRDYAQLFEVAKFMSLAKAAIPKFLQGNPWDCLAIILRAREWRMSPYAVAGMAYLTEGQRGEQTIAYMSQLVHAVIEARAPIKGRLEHRYEGEGDDRVCIVSAVLHSGKVIEHASAPLGVRRPKSKQGTDKHGNKYTYVPGSPLWLTKPDVQQFYDTSRDFARIYFPDVLMGVYSDDEMKEVGYTDITNRQLRQMPAAQQADIDPGMSSRLTPEAIKRAGFNVDHINSEIDKVNGSAESVSSSDDAAAAGRTAPQTPAADASKRSRRRKVAEPAPADTVAQTQASEPAPATGVAETADASPEAPEGSGGTLPPDEELVDGR